MRFAVVGSGIAGLAAAWQLAKSHQVTLFEAESRLGGHTNTVSLKIGRHEYALDTGFIVYNERTYPGFTRLLDELGVATQASDMSFSVSSQRNGWEYSGNSLNSLFAQRRNLARPAFYRMLCDILRFNRRAPTILHSGDALGTLGEYAIAEQYSGVFLENYLTPMAAAIWSAPAHKVLEFPVRQFVQFYVNHGLLSLTDRPQWRTITGGAARYIKAMQSTRAFDVRLRTPVKRILRTPNSVEVATVSGIESFDQVVLAAHADQSLALLADATAAEREVLGAFEFVRNEAVLHVDTSWLPSCRRAWASWNYRIPKGKRSAATVTYWLNRLQRLDAPLQFFVTLNDDGAISPQSVVKRITYHHPMVTARSIAAQRRHGEISGQLRTHFCGAYWGYGFHEDGVQSATTVVRQIDESMNTCIAASTKARSGTAALVR